MTIVQRVSQHTGQWPDTVPPPLRRVYEHRGIFSIDGLERSPQSLLDPAGLKGIDIAAERIVDAIERQEHIVVSGDYDCDGATGTAVGVLGLTLLGANHVSFIVPNRDLDGYGLTKGLVDRMPEQTQLIITVDAGISSIEGVAYARAKGMDVVVTDHHLPGEQLPDAIAIVNPNQPGDTFASKSLAGCGVMFYTLLAVKRLLKQRHWPKADARLFEHLLPIVAVGTVADLVPLDQNNRTLVHAGLLLMRHGHCPVGLQALCQAVPIEQRYITAQDIAFKIAPKINAAGRLHDITLGVRLLLEQNFVAAYSYAKRLEEINEERKAIQAESMLAAEAMVQSLPKTAKDAIVLYDPQFHHGIVGLIASKLKEQLHRPTFVFADAEEGMLRGSGRSIEGLHLRDALAYLDSHHPGMIVKFGGHAMAAGLTLHKNALERFTSALEDYVGMQLTDDMRRRQTLSDGALEPQWLTLDFALQLEQAGPWGQGFPAPVFDQRFELVDCWPLKEKHLRLILKEPESGQEVEAIWFFAPVHEPLPSLLHLAYELTVNRYQSQRLQLRILEWQR